MKIKIDQNPVAGYSYVMNISGTETEIDEVKQWLEINFSIYEYRYIINVFKHKFKGNSMTAYFNENSDEILTLFRLTWM